MMLVTNILLVLLCLYDIVVFGQKYVPKHLHDPDLQIQLPKGIVQGTMKQTVNKQMPYYSFGGIPYALPPTGRRRFKAPEPANSWGGVLNTATPVVPICIQITPSIFNDGLVEREDCLFINIFTTDFKNSSMPVMVWIHGGGFLMGLPNSTYYGPDYLLEQDVIVVHFGYRLNSFGFLSTEDLEAPGNNGLKDQRMALEWVKENIEYFGGNSSRITIFGESAGGVSVQQHLLNLKNEGLFQQAISESGSALCLWAFQRNPRTIAFDLGLLAGIKSDDSRELVKRLQKLSASKLKALTIAVTLLNSLGIANGIPFAPSIEVDHPDAFFTEKSYQAMLKGKMINVPYLLGYNSKESYYAQQGLRFSFLGLYSTNKILEKWDTDPKLLIPIDMNLNNEDSSTVGKAIKEFYLENNSLSRSEQYLEFINDGYFLRPIIESARLFSKFIDTYFYKFNYDGYYLGKKALGYLEDSAAKGVQHTEEMWYLFSRNDLIVANDTDRNVRTKMVKMWTNFAKYGNPTPANDDPTLDNIVWPKLEDGDKFTHLVIDGHLEVKEKMEEEGVKFWKKLYDLYGNPPYDTY